MELDEQELNKEFHAISCGKTFLSGHLPKGFFWIDGEFPMSRPASRIYGIAGMRSIAFGELINGIRKGESYQVYFKNAICGKNLSGIIPKNILCLVKQMDMTTDNSEVYGETVGCRLAARMGINTVFNVAYSNPDEADLFDNNYHNYLISVNYVPCGGSVFDMGVLGVSWDRGTPLREIFENIDSEFPRYLESCGIEPTQKMIDKFKRDFGEQWLFRVMLCGDSDYEEHNVLGTILPDGNVICGPCADMEYFFNCRSMKYEDVTQDGMLYLQQTMPRMVDSFIVRLNDAHLDGSLNDIMSRSRLMDDWHKRKKIQILNENRRNMMSLWKQNKRIISEKEKEALTF